MKLTGGVENRLQDWNALVPGIEDMEVSQAIGAYYNAYYEEINRLQKIFPERIAVFDMQELNEPKNILDWVGVPPEKRPSAELKKTNSSKEWL